MVLMQVFDIRRIEEGTYYPYIKSSGIIWFLMAMEGKIEVTEGSSDVNLWPNAPAFFFVSISYE